MKIQIVYLSKTGNTRKAAQALADHFADQHCRLVDLSRENATMDADVYLLGFGIRKGAVPFAILDQMEELEGKAILLFSTAGLAAFADYKTQLERQLIPFLPFSGEYLGLILVPGSFEKEGFDYLKSTLKNADDPVQVEKLYDLQQRMHDHPDQNDLNELCSQIRERLNLDE